MHFMGMAFTASASVNLRGRLLVLCILDRFHVGSTTPSSSNRSGPCPDKQDRTGAEDRIPEDAPSRATEKERSPEKAPLMEYVRELP